jgi:hypothetical protein
MKLLFFFTPKVGRSDEVAGEFSAENQATDAGFTGVGRWTQHLVLNPSGAVLARRAPVHLLLGRGTLAASVEAILRRRRS